MISKIAGAHASLARAAGLSVEALEAALKGDGAAAAKLLQEAKKALFEAKAASSEICDESWANDD